MKAELLKGQRLAVAEDGEVLVWTMARISPRVPSCRLPSQGYPLALLMYYPR